MLFPSLCFVLFFCIFCSSYQTEHNSLQQGCDIQCWVFGECKKQKVNASLLSLPFPLQDSNELVPAASTCRHRRGERLHLAHDVHNGRASSKGNSISGQMGKKMLFKLGLQQASQVNWVNCPDLKCYLIGNNKIADHLNKVHASYTSHQYTGSPKHRGYPLSQTCCNQTVWYPEFKQQVKSCRSCWSYLTYNSCFWMARAVGPTYAEPERLHVVVLSPGHSHRLTTPQTITSQYLILRNGPHITSLFCLHFLSAPWTNQYMEKSNFPFISSTTYWVILS